jgi:hypothetical protein
MTEENLMDKYRKMVEKDVELSMQISQDIVNDILKDTGINNKQKVMRLCILDKSINMVLKKFRNCISEYDNAVIDEIIGLTDFDFKVEKHSISPEVANRIDEIRNCKNINEVIDKLKKSKIDDNSKKILGNSMFGQSTAGNKNNNNKDKDNDNFPFDD